MKGFGWDKEEKIAAFCKSFFVQSNEFAQTSFYSCAISQTKWGPFVRRY